LKEHKKHKPVIRPVSYMTCHNYRNVILQTLRQTHRRTKS